MLYSLHGTGHSGGIYAVCSRQVPSLCKLHVDECRQHKSDHCCIHRFNILYRTSEIKRLLKCTTLDTKWYVTHQGVVVCSIEACTKFVGVPNINNHFKQCLHYSTSGDD